MPLALIGMGSNINPEQHLLTAAVVMREKFSDVSFSSVYRSKAVGMDGDDFLNACCLFQYDADQQALLIFLKGIEDNHGRDRSAGSWKPRTLDLDLLMIDQDVVDGDVYRYAHVFVPASELVVYQKPERMDVSLVQQVDLRL